MRRARCAGIRVEVELADRLDAPRTGDGSTAIVERDQLDRGFGRLAPEARALIVLHHYLDLPLPEVAATLRIPLGDREVAPPPRAPGAAGGARRGRPRRPRPRRRAAA